MKNCIRCCSVICLLFLLLLVGCSTVNENVSTGSSVNSIKENFNDIKYEIDFEIGMPGPAGGYIFYDCDADNGSGNADGLKSSECGWRYLEAAPEDLPGSYVWGDDGRFRTKKGIGKGRNNTEIIIKKASKKRSDNAAFVCKNYSVGGYSDWFLPSIDEINLMYMNLYLIGLGNFKNNSYAWYLSSSEDSIGGYYKYAWGESFAYGSYQYSKKRDGSTTENDIRPYYYVRPVRAFI